jgi:arylsulfatase
MRSYPKLSGSQQRPLEAELTWILLLFAACSTGNIPEENQPLAPRAQQPQKGIPSQPGEMDLVGELADNPRSILIVSWDTVRQDAAGLGKNPGIRALQAQSRTYTQAISHFPETGVSHWSLMTGVEPEIHGNVPGTANSRYRGPTLAEITRHSGYKTAAFIGGLTLTNQSTGLGRGFEIYDDTWDWMRKGVRPAKEVTQRAVNWIRQQDGPYFAFVHLFEAHHPYTPMPGFEVATGQGDRPATVQREFNNYQSEIRYIDSLLGDLLRAVGEDTVVVLTADHGESFEHDYLYNHRESLWESTLNVPLVIRGPGLAPGSESNDLVALTDVFPTVLALAGLPSESKTQGFSLLQAPQRQSVDALTDPWIGETYNYAVRTATHKVIWTADNKVLVYDLIQDPQEESALSEVPEALKAARSRYRERIVNAKALQRPALKNRFLPQGEAEKLRALGYVGQNEDKH